MKHEAIRQEEVEESGEYQVRARIGVQPHMIMIFLGLAFAVHAANILVEQATI